MMLRVLMILVLALPLPVTAQIYRTTDEHGNVVFTDQPPAGNANSEQVDMQPTNTVAPPPSIPRPAPAAEAAASEKPPLTVAITSPADDSTIPMGPGNFSVTAQLSGGLQPGQKLQLLLDGSAHGEPQQGFVWKLTNVFRGEHTLSVAILDKAGKTLTTSEPVTVFVLRPSVLFN